ncbi:acyl-CoA dehydrogenase [Streptomyces qinzhouensis]|uniref:Acyl-CoA dehydrogenase n=1 Tax=Streptomyces qinzhouensis TaxID=2599401 RepID=A0A5B8JF23_9ACTN|nr:acyl-CoA dehydrogenase [Streptomyces qinzhouensis]QDY80066.1 acyl-CoA dehydrogenase [Streptomyces qinzhouensis]
MLEPSVLNPQSYDPAEFDETTRRLLRASIEWFEKRGKQALVESYGTWFAEFLAFAGEQGIFAHCLVPADAAQGAGRWDTARNAAFNEVLAFYGINGWYTWHVTMLGLAPVWQSRNETARRRTVELLRQGHSAAFALSEKEHGADIYATDLILTPTGNGHFSANGSKHYIGNGNVAGIVTVFGRRADIEGPDGYVFFLADSRHPSYTAVRNIANTHLFVGEIGFDGYPVGPADILHTGRPALDVALNTVNIGKFNLGTAGIGACEHAFHESLNHAHRRMLYGRRVTDLPHIRSIFGDAYLRLIAMKMFTNRVVDYVKSAHADDRRYILFTALSKTKVTTEAEKVVALLWDVIAAKGFEAGTHFNWVARDLPGLPRLEGTVHVNTALILKFLHNHLLAEPVPYDPVPSRTDASDDRFLFEQGPTGGLGKVRFHDWRPAFDRFADVPNVARFREQVEGFRELLLDCGPTPRQREDLDLMLPVGQLFMLVVYGQLILEHTERADRSGPDRDLLDEIFALLIRDFAGALTELHGKPGATDEQRARALSCLRVPAHDADRTARTWRSIEAIACTYEMQP